MDATQTPYPERNPRRRFNASERVTLYLAGTSEAATVRRLRKDRPDLHAKYLANEISANAAAILAGFRPKTFTVRADKPESIVATLRRQLPPEVLNSVVKMLNKSRETES